MAIFEHFLNFTKTIPKAVFTCPLSLVEFQQEIKILSANEIGTFSWDTQ